MNLEPRYQRAACLAVLLGITAYATAAEWLLLAVVAVPLVIGLWRFSSRPVSRLLLPRWAVNLFLSGALVYAALRTVTRGPDVEGVAELVILLQLIKLGDRRAPRDDAQIIALSVFLAISAMLTSNELWVGLQLMAFLPVLIGAVMLHQLHAGQSIAREATGSAGAPRPVVGRRFVAHLRAVGAMALGCAMVSSVVVFVLMPRGIGESAFGAWQRASARHVTGFTDTVRLGAGGLISQSPEIVLDLRVSSSAGGNLGSLDSFHYLRGTVLEKYERGVWVRPQGGGTVRNVSRGESQGFGENPAIALVEQTITLRSLGQDGQPLFLLWRPVQIEFITPGRATVDASRTRTGRVYPSPSEHGQTFEYRVMSALQPIPGIPEVRSQRVPDFPNPRIKELGARIAADAGLDPDPATRPVAEDEQIALAIERHLRGTFRYTLDEHASPAGIDPIEYFLFETREGHCEYFASAMTALCRAAGINARMAVGYLAAEYNDAAEVYTVRASNAHAWVEAEIGANRWRRYDPTPAAELARIHRPRVGVLGRLRQWLDALEFLWNSRVVSFDERARERVIGRTAGADGPPGILGRIDLALQRIRRGGPGLVRDAAVGGLGVFLIVAGAGAVGVMLMRSGRLKGRRAGAGARSRARRPVPMDAALAARLAQALFYERLLLALARRGHPKPLWQPPLEHAAALVRIDPPLGEGTAALGRLYYRVRFGARSLSDPERREADAILDRISGRPGPQRS